MGSTAGRGVPVLVVDGDGDSRRLLVALLERIGCRSYEASTGEDALAVAEAVRPSLVLLEVALADISGYEICRELRDRFGDEVSLVFISGTRVDRLDRIAGLLIGADDYLVKPFDGDELLARVRQLLRRANGRRNGPDETSSSRDPLAALTHRESEVLALLARGLNQRAIADELVISSTTVATHIQRVLAKLGVHSRAQAVTLAHQHGLVDADVEAHSDPATPIAAA